MTSEGNVCALRGAMGFTTTVLVILAVVLSTTRSLRAEDAKKPSLQDRLKAWKIDVKTHRKKRDASALKTDFEKARSLYEDAASDEKLRGKLITAFGTAAKGSKDEELHKSVIMLLSDLGDVRGARYLKPYLKQRDKSVASPLLDLAVGAAADLPDACLVGPLLKIVTDSRHMGILQDAVASLGKYRSVKSKRVKIIEVLLKAAKKCKPGGRPRMRGPQESLDGGFGEGGPPQGREGSPTARWNALCRSVPRALKELTSIEQSSVQDWFLIAKSNKGKLGKLFPKD